MAAFKDSLNLENAEKILKALARGGVKTNPSRLLQRLKPRLQSGELKDRVRLIAEVLHQELPQDSRLRGRVLLQMCQDQDLRAAQNFFLFWPVLQVVESYGLQWPQESFHLLRELTKTFSAEFAIRPYLLQDPKGTRASLFEWAQDPDPKVRRLVSEGTRPLLPWGQKLHFILEDPDWSLPLLELLKSDPDEVVRRSVANHLNDFSKQHGDLVVAVVSRWAKEDSSPERRQLVRHALRTLIKRGHPKALALMGVKADMKGLTAKWSFSPARIKIGGSLEWRLQLKNSSKKPLKVEIDSVLFYRKKSGELSPKVFKGGRVELSAGEQILFVRKLSFKPVTVRKLYPGEQALALQINGVQLPKRRFLLVQRS